MASFDTEYNRKNNRLERSFLDRNPLFREPEQFPTMIGGGHSRKYNLPDMSNQEYMGRGAPQLIIHKHKGKLYSMPIEVHQKMVGSGMHGGSWNDFVHFMTPIAKPLAKALITAGVATFAPELAPLVPVAYAGIDAIPLAGSGYGYGHLGYGVLDDRFSLNDIKRTGEDLFGGNRGYGVLDDRFSLNDIKRTGKELFGGKSVLDQQFSVNQAKSAFKDLFGMGKMKRTRKPSARGEVVKQVMREHGMNLGQASKYVKQHGLY